MHFDVDFRDLKRAVYVMGANSIPIDFVIDVQRGIAPLESIEIELKKGITLGDLSDVIADTQSGVLTYHGRHTVLYIQDQGTAIGRVLANGERGRRVHVTDCSTLEAMKRSNRFERYVLTSDVSGEFYVTGPGSFGARVEGKARLKVCRNCLTKLNYKKYPFQWSEFFATYRSKFSSYPKRTSGEYDGGYTADWSRISTEFRRTQEFKCESCRVDLSNHRGLLHAHHINAVKTDNRRENLKALCVVCHSQQPGHMSMKVLGVHADIIARLRRDQGLK